MAFFIDLLEEPAPEGESVRSGLITIGSYRERFIAPIHYWDESQYRRHWQTALTGIVAGSSKSALITSMYEPASANFIFWWPMYRLDDTVYFQNQILFLGELETPFDPNDPFRFVRERTIVNSDGEQISEWSAPITDLESFLKIS